MSSGRMKDRNRNNERVKEKRLDRVMSHRKEVLLASVIGEEDKWTKWDKLNMYLRHLCWEDRSSHAAVGKRQTRWTESN